MKLFLESFCLLEAPAYKWKNEFCCLQSFWNPVFLGIFQFDLIWYEISASFWSKTATGVIHQPLPAPHIVGDGCYTVWYWDDLKHLGYLGVVGGGHLTFYSGKIWGWSQTWNLVPDFPVTSISDRTSDSLLLGPSFQTHLLGWVYFHILQYHDFWTHTNVLKSVISNSLLCVLFFNKLNT